MKYQELIESCKKAIAEGRCLGCTALEDLFFEGNRNCIYGKVQTAEDSIKQIKINLGIQEKLKL